MVEASLAPGVRASYQRYLSEFYRFRIGKGLEVKWQPFQFVMY